MLLGLFMVEMEVGTADEEWVVEMNGLTGIEC
jgi:hypothetical protein